MYVTIIIYHWNQLKQKQQQKNAIFLAAVVGPIIFCRLHTFNNNKVT